MDSRRIAALENAIRPLREKLVDHELYRRMQNLKELRFFTEKHVWAVWDFMSLLKFLQRELTCIDIPWIPEGNPETRFLINEIVTGEESDVDPNGNRISHFELYLRAMTDLGANTAPMQQAIMLLRNGKPVKEVIQSEFVPAVVRPFLSYTFDIIDRKDPALAAAAFTYGREDLIPDMFIGMVERLATTSPAQVALFRYYLERHIEVDGDHHSHLGKQMLASLCGDDAIKWNRAIEAAKGALRARLDLWDGILAQLPQSQPEMANK